MADLPVIEFIQQRLAESDASLETRKGSAFYDLFVKPQELMLQPLFEALETVLTSQSVRRVESLADPNSFDESLVDDLVANVYIERVSGDYSKTTVRVFYEEPVDREYPALSAEFSSGDLSFFNEQDILISKQEMALQQSGTLFYMDVPVRSQFPGLAYNVAQGAITGFVNDIDAVTVTNLTAAVGGLSRETNLQVLNRAKNSIGVRDLETVKGINSTLLTKFPYLKKVRAIGMGDPEMMRDIIYNTHVGGATDIYVKVPSLTEVTKDFIGVEFDTTRKINRSAAMPVSAKVFSDSAAALGTPYLVSGSVSVKDDFIDTRASTLSADIDPSTGINLTAGAYIKLSVDGGPFEIIKISGSTPAQTRRFEIIGAINAALGVEVAFPAGPTKISLRSPVTGARSRLTFAVPDAPRLDATGILFPEVTGLGYSPLQSTSSVTLYGVSAVTYIEGIDYEVDYLNGKIIQLADSAILCGKTLYDSDQGKGRVIAGRNELEVLSQTAFLQVRVGDMVYVRSSVGIAAGAYTVQEKISGGLLRLLGAFAHGDSVQVEFSVVSNQTLSVSYQHHPLSIDIGHKVLGSDGFSRGVREGRTEFTLKAYPLVVITAIEEIDPDTGELLDNSLRPPSGFGGGGFGEGGFGVSGQSDYRLVVNDPTTRFTVFEDSLIALHPSLLGKSFRVTALAAPEIEQIHDFCRNDLERVTGADILPKCFVPAFVDVAIKVRLKGDSDAAKLTTLQAAASEFIAGLSADSALDASELAAIMEKTGLVESVQIPFLMTARILNTDGSTTIVTSYDLLKVPDGELAKVAANFVTPRIAHFFPGNVSVGEI